MKPRLQYTLPLLLLLILNSALAQKITSLNATAKGKGTLTISTVDKQEIRSVMVVLKENGDAEIRIFTDLQLYAQGTWSVGDSLSAGIDLKITGGILKDNATGVGKLFLRDDGTSIRELTIRAESATGSKVTVDFVADAPEKIKP